MTDRELADAATAHLKATTIAYPKWWLNVQHGIYTPKDGSGTEWGKAFAALEAIDVAPPPPPPIPTPALNDQRAVLMDSLSSTGAVVNPDGTPNGQPASVIVRSQVPALWSSLLYTNDDVSVVPDDRYTKVYRYRTNGQSRNPYWSSPTTCNTSLERTRALTIGQWDWYGLSILWEPGWDWTRIEQSTVMQCGYPTITSPPLSLDAGYGDHVYVVRYAGPVTQDAAGRWRAAEYELWNIRQHSELVGHWVEFVIGVQWGSHSDGALEVYSRVAALGEQGFTQHIAETEVNTWQWGGALNVPRDPISFGVVDKQDSYESYAAGVTDATVPETFLRHRGYVRCATKEAALSYLP